MLSGRSILCSWIILFLIKQAPEVKALNRREAKQSPEALTDPVKTAVLRNWKRRVLGEKWMSENFTVPVPEEVQYQYYICAEKRLLLFRTKYVVIFRDKSWL